MTERTGSHRDRQNDSGSDATSSFQNQPIPLGMRVAVGTSRRAYRLGVMEALDQEVVELVELVRSFAYGRPSDRTIEAMLREGRGTCSAKHRYLAQKLHKDFPDLEPRIVHRVYRVDREGARWDFGAQVAAVVPPEGLVDVHRYLTIELNGRRVIIDATFPGPPWDGHSDLPLACGPGVDHPSESDPDQEKRALEGRYCDPVLRDRFIEALS